MDKEQEKINETIEWCEKNNITIFFGRINEETDSNIVSWKSSSLNEHLKFLGVAKESGISLLILDNTKNTLFSADKENVRQTKEFLEGEQLEKFIGALNKVKLFADQTAGFRLYFLKDGAFFEYESRAEWMDHYITAYNLLIEDEDDFEDFDNEKPLPKAEIKKLGRELSENLDFQNCRNNSQREFVASKVFNEKYDGTWALNNIIEAASNIFKVEVEPKLKKELRKKVNELASKGLSQSQIAKELDISLLQVRNI